MTGQRVVVIDDNDDVRNWLATALAELGWEVTATRNGRHGLELAAELRPDIVIAELALPDMRGLQLPRALRPLVPGDVLMIAWTRLADQLGERALAAGFDHVQAKHRDVAVLHEQMLQLTARRRSDRCDRPSPTPRAARSSM